MACNHPLHAFDTGFLEDSGKPHYKIVGGDKEWIYKPTSRDGKGYYSDIKLTNYIEVPCGRCIACRLSYAKEWATRCMLEARQYKQNYFITITYAPEHVPVNKELGNLILEPKDLQDFLKRLRKYYDQHYKHQNIRFYACGEYGSTTQRPHYHILAFNLPIFDLMALKRTASQDQLYYSKTIEKIWGKGNVWIGEVNWNTCAYVARYIMKKQKGPDAEQHYIESGEVPEFVRMSRRPGIGQKYFEDNYKDIYLCDAITLSKRNKYGKMEAIQVKPARYYDKLYDQLEPEQMAQIKQARVQSAKETEKLRQQRSTLTKLEYLEQKEKRLEISTKALVRNLE